MPSETVRPYGLMAACGLAISLQLSQPAAAQSQPPADPFFAGKTITMLTESIGGTYDGYLRLLARHMPKYIEGAPTMVVAHRPGAGGLAVVNTLGRTGPQDGSMLGIVSQGLYLHEAIGSPGLQVSMGELHWIGNFSQSNQVTIARRSKAATIAEAQQREVILGASGAAGGSAKPAILYNSLIGTKFKILFGYRATEVVLGMKRGEVDGVGSIAWAAAKTFIMPQVDKNDVSVLIQLGLRKEADLPDVPLLSDLVAGDASKLAISRFAALTSVIARAVAGPPGLPANRLAIYRYAFDRVIEDPEFLAEADKANLDVNPMSGDEVRQAVAETLATPKAIIEAAKIAMGDAAK